MDNTPSKLNLRMLWLKLDDQDDSMRNKYLLLEDIDTGDVVTLLIYMKDLFKANYSRKLASLKNKVVMREGEGGSGQAADSQLYWKWAFESPHEIKVQVRQWLGDEISNGHLRLVLLPIVYNALIQKKELRETKLFKRLHLAMKHSTYYDLLPKKPDQAELQSIADELGEGTKLFAGPHNIRLTLEKYTEPYSEACNSEKLFSAAKKRPKVTENVQSSSDSGGQSMQQQSITLEQLWKKQQDFQQRVLQEIGILRQESQIQAQIQQGHARDLALMRHYMEEILRHQQQQQQQQQQQSHAWAPGPASQSLPSHLSNHGLGGLLPLDSSWQERAMQQVTASSPRDFSLSLGCRPLQPGGPYHNGDMQAGVPASRPATPIGAQGVGEALPLGSADFGPLLGLSSGSFSRQGVFQAPDLNPGSPTLANLAAHRVGANLGQGNK